jgi:hypothetical protein
MLEQTELQIGELVRLNSGSPDLKVVAFDGDQVEMEWVGESGNLERMMLPKACFRKAAEN